MRVLKNSAFRICKDQSRGFKAFHTGFDKEIDSFGEVRNSVS
jgi:hypothetical protein